MEVNQYYLKRALEIGQLGTWDIDLQTGKLVWTDQAVIIFGIETGTPLTYECFLSCIHPYDVERVDREWKRSLGTGVYDFKHRIAADEEGNWVQE